MTKLSQDQFNEVMNAIKSPLSTHREFLYAKYGFSGTLEGKLEELQKNIKDNLEQITQQDD